MFSISVWLGLACQVNDGLPKVEVNRLAITEG